MTEIVLNPLPDSVRNEILRDDKFCSRIAYKPRFAVPLGSARVRTESLQKALRAAIVERKAGTLVLADGKKAKVALRFQKPDKATIILDKEGFTLADADLLSEDKKVRTSGLRRVFATRPLLAEEQEYWRRIAQSRPFTDREFVALMTDVGATPEAFYDGLRRPKTLNLSNLLPEEPGYFQRLTAPRGSAKNLAEFVAGELAGRRRALLKKNKKLAIRRIAYSALARDLVPFDLMNVLKPSDFNSLLAASDPFSLLFAFEVASARILKEKRFEGLGTKALEKLFVDDKASVARSTIFSACAMISAVRLRTVFSELEAPLFWFRLAAFSHAGVLTNALAALPRPDEFLDWAGREIGTSFVWYTAVDRRDAPRWDIEWLSPEQIRAELLGRVLNAMRRLRGKKYPKNWDAIVQKAKANVGAAKELNAFYPGPMDDFVHPVAVKKRNPHLLEIEKKLKRTKSLDKIPNIAALVYLERPSAVVAENVRRLLEGERKGTGGFEENESARLQLYAHLAASARSEPLANEIINCCLRLIRTRKMEARQVSDFLIAIVTACGAIADHEKYGTLLGDAAAKIAYSVLDDQVSTQQVKLVCDVLGYRDPKLIPHVSRAIAITEAELLRH